MRLFPLVLLLVFAGCGREEEKRLARLEAELRAEKQKREELERRVNPVQVPTATLTPTPGEIPPPPPPINFTPTPSPSPSPVEAKKPPKVETENVESNLPKGRAGDLEIFSNGEKVAWIVTGDAGACVAINGKPGKQYAAVEHPLRITPDGRDVFYVASAGEKKDRVNLFVVGGEIKAQRKGKIGSPVVASDRRVAFIANEYYEEPPLRKERHFIVVDGKEGARHESISDLLFHPDGRTIVYEIGRWVGKYDEHAIVIGEKTGPFFFQISDLQATPDGHIAYLGNRSGQGHFLVLDETEKLLGKNVGYDFARSPDGSRLAFTVPREPGEAVKLDGKTGPVYASMSELSFSPDGKRFACYADVTGKWLRGGDLTEREGHVVMLDGDESAEYGDIWLRFAWSPKGTRLGYKVQMKGEEMKWRVVIGDFVSDPFDAVSMPAFPEENLTRFFALEGGSLKRVTVRW